MSVTTGELTTWTLPAETKEWVGPITVTADGVPVTNFEVTVTAGAGRPTTWYATEVLEGERGVLVGAGTAFPLRPGQRYTVWTRYTDVPEVPVTRIGTIRVV